MRATSIKSSSRLMSKRNAWRSHGNHTVTDHGGGQAQTVQRIQHLLLGHGHADHLAARATRSCTGFGWGILAFWSSMAATCVSGVPQISSTSAVMRSMCSVVNSGSTPRSKR